MIKVEVLNEEYNEATTSFTNRKITQNDKDKEGYVDFAPTPKSGEVKNITNSSLKLKTNSSYSLAKVKNRGTNDLSATSQNESILQSNENSDNEYNSQYNDLYKISRRKKNKMKYNTPLIDRCALITDRDLFSEKKALTSYLFLKHLAIKLSLNKKKDNEKFINFDALRAKASHNSAFTTNPLIGSNSNDQEGKFVVIKPKDSPHRSCLGLIKIKNFQGQKKSFTLNLEKTTNLPESKSNQMIEKIKEEKKKDMFILTPKVNRQPVSVRFVNANITNSGNKIQSIPLGINNDKDSCYSKEYNSSSETSPTKESQNKKLKKSKLLNI